MAGLIFDWPIRVYYEDTDSGGVVYHSNYLNFMERARTEWLRSLGFEQTVLKDEMGILFVVRKLNIQYKKPAKFDDTLVVQTCIKKYKKCMLIFSQQILQCDSLLVAAEVEVVCVDALQFKPIRLPQSIKKVVEKLVAEQPTLE